MIKNLLLEISKQRLISSSELKRRQRAKTIVDKINTLMNNLDIKKEDK
jgi:hypothetical protein